MALPTTLPTRFERYNWLLKLAPLPKMVVTGIELICRGIHEIRGGKDNPIIISMATDIGVGNIYLHDETAWCALAHNWNCWKNGKPLAPLNHGDLYDLLRAKSFRSWGNEVAVPMLGDTLVFKRPNGFHVGLYIAEDELYYHVMGGNQSDSYTITRIEKTRLLTARRFYATAPPATVRQIIVAPGGTISTNEQ
jgi:uncharacterized protein (TIGR02594 family)